MTCDQYENVLRNTAASNDKLHARLARHLEHCSTCRMTLRSERELLSRIDAAVRAQVNENPSSAFLAQLRLQLSKEVASGAGSNRVWHLAGVVALALILIAAFYPLVNIRQVRLQANLDKPTIKVGQSGPFRQSAHASEVLALRSRHHSKRSGVQSPVRQGPEILVPPDERQAFVLFVACVARRDAMAQAAVTPAANKIVNTNTELPQVSFVAITDLQLGRAGQEKWLQASSSE